ncbi:hypothetical protein [Kitasatospora sp. NPDC005856]|uniref:hypothetical protein n=1 Tax=Kitasatospora sp. NPDC005856 TaxID=3154566 RepID=UPI00340F7F28
MTPSAEQLDHLIGHTSNRRLTPEEHALLRANVWALRDFAGRLALAAGQLSTVARENLEHAEQAEGRIAAIRELHQPVTGYTGWGPDDDPTPGAYGAISQACSACGSEDNAIRWPCATVRALDNASASPTSAVTVTPGVAVIGTGDQQHRLIPQQDPAEDRLCRCGHLATTHSDTHCQGCAADGIQILCKHPHTAS